MAVELRLRADDPAALAALAEYAVRRLGESRCACAGDGSYHIRRDDYECPCFRVPEPLTVAAECGCEAESGEESKQTAFGRMLDDPIGNAPNNIREIWEQQAAKGDPIAQANVDHIRKVRGEA